MQNNTKCTNSIKFINHADSRIGCHLNPSLSLRLVSCLSFCANHPFSRKKNVSKKLEWQPCLRTPTHGRDLQEPGVPQLRLANRLSDCDPVSRNVDAIETLIWSDMISQVYSWSIHMFEFTWSDASFRSWLMQTLLQPGTKFSQANCCTTEAVGIVSGLKQLFQQLKSWWQHRHSRWCLRCLTGCWVKRNQLSVTGTMYNVDVDDLGFHLHRAEVLFFYGTEICKITTYHFSRNHISRPPRPTLYYVETW